MIENPTFQKECMAYITLPGIKYPYIKGLKSLSFPKIFSLYCSFKHGITLKIWAEENQVLSLNIDIRNDLNYFILDDLYILG